MGWLKDKLFKKPANKTGYADMLNGFTPIYSQFGSDIYASDVVQQAINCIVSEVKKLKPQHIRKTGESGADITSVNSDIQKVLRSPNEIMTAADFLEKITWQLFFNYNSFIVPTFYTWKDEKGQEQRRYSGLYPIQPVQVDFIQDAKNALYVKFRFANNYETTLKYSDIIHIRYRYSINEYMGGNAAGQPDNDALLKTLSLNETMLNGIAKGMKASYAVNGVVKYKSLIDDGQTEAALKELEKKLLNNESGFLPMDISSEYIPLSRDIQLVDADTLKFIDEKILRHFGVPLPILTGDYTKQQYEAFYQKTIEPLVISFSQAFTKGLFTAREQSFGNEIQFYPKDLIFMSTDQTLQMVNLLGASGALYENEKRVAFGLRPLPELEGKRLQSLNYVDAAIANKYQVGNEGAQGGDAVDERALMLAMQILLRAQQANQNVNSGGGKN